MRRRRDAERRPETWLNALISADTARLGFLTTRGHADSISIMNLDGRYAGLDPRATQDMPRTNKPAPLLPKRLIREIDERIDYKGEVIVAPDEAGTRPSRGAPAVPPEMQWHRRGKRRRRL